ncbi:hypothetical protein FOMPIDRAFT_1016487 [Fomitopsis schrenkii]|uniref:Uncharacterized protein n=1 Tax=Fomitopsis schrenkii TaxID=2126942 RepID=S8FQ12_FOMSC|nr:hypothetical protein FOMPIDRAFT_1016487 [Fomitopsis schrenkii]
MNYSPSDIIRDSGVFIGAIGGAIGAGAAAWQVYFAHHTRLREANRLIAQISEITDSLTEDDKAAIDAYIAEVSASNPQESRCLLDTQRMLARLADAQARRTDVSRDLAANPLFNFPWSDLARSIKVLLRRCRDLHRSVQVVHRSRLLVIDQYVSSFNQQYQTPSPTISTFIQQPPSLYTGSSPSGSPYSHTGFTGTSSLSGYSGHTVGGGPNYAYPPNPSSPTLPTDRGQPFIYNAGPSQPTYPPYPGQSMTPSATVSTTSLYPASTASQDQGSTRSLQTNQSAQYSSQYSASSGTSGYGKYLIFHCPFDVHDRRLRDLCKPSLIGIICLELDAVVGQCNRWASLMCQERKFVEGAEHRASD